METIIRHEHDISDWFYLRKEEPLTLFGRTYTHPSGSWIWEAIIWGIVGIGVLYVLWMYIRERRTIGWVWPLPLVLLRISVYVLLGILFLMPAKRHTFRDVIRTDRDLRVVVLFDTSLSM